MRVAPAFAQELRSLQGQRGLVASAHADDGLPEKRRVVGRKLQLARLVAFDAPQRFLRCEGVRLDGLGAVGPGEIAIEGIGREPIAAGRLLGLYPARQVIRRFEFAHDDGTLLHRGSQALITPLPEPGQQGRQLRKRQKSSTVGLGSLLGSVVSAWFFTLVFFSVCIKSQAEQIVYATATASRAGKAVMQRSL